MFAVIKTGGKQYKVAVEDQFAIEKLDAEPGQPVLFDEVLMLGGETVTVGTPFVDGAAVKAEVVDQFKGPKTINFKKRRRKHSSQRKKGHRQPLTMIRVTDILASGADKAKAEVQAKPAPKATPKPTPETVEAATPKAAAPEVVEAAAPEAAAPEVSAAQPGNLLTEAKGTADDLKKISGVGPKLEQTLNEIGVFHFWQIAEWGPEEIAFMDDRLKFKGRIERDDWIAQATKFRDEAE